ncbi:MAG: hypothetical protein K5867_02945 [Bacteroidales bacterium]|nr:hypothetical protein [Bacteroidales bacterium]
MAIVFSLNNGCTPIKNTVSTPGSNWYECTIVDKTLYELIEDVMSKECDSALYYSIVFSHDSIEPSIDVYKVCKGDASSIDETVSLVGTNEYFYNRKKLFLIQTEYANKSRRLRKYKDHFVKKKSITMSPCKLNNIPVHRKRLHVARYDNSKYFSSKMGL